jgi:hypothetical protein
MDLNELEAHLVGAKYEYPRAEWMIRQCGPVETLEGTNNSWWVAYFQGGGFTMLVEKKTDTIMALRPGRHPGPWATWKRRPFWKR